MAYQLQFSKSFLLSRHLLEPAISLKTLPEGDRRVNEFNRCFREYIKRLTFTIGGSTKAGFREHALRAARGSRESGDGLPGQLGCLLSTSSNQPSFACGSVYGPFSRRRSSVACRFGGSTNEIPIHHSCAHVIWLYWRGFGQATF